MSPILMTPWTVLCQAPLSMRFSRQEYWSGLTFPSPGDVPNPGIEPGLMYCRQILYQLSYEGGPIMGLTTPWTAACQASLSFTNSQSFLKCTSIKSVMPSSHLILCHPLFLLPLIPPSVRVFSNESTLPTRWPNTGVSALPSFLPKNTQD